MSGCNAVGKFEPPTRSGVIFWSSIYIPVVVAMAASQNVLTAINGGTVAILAGVLSVIVCFALVPLISRIGSSDDSDELGDPASEKTLMELWIAFESVLTKYSLVTAFALVGAIIAASYWISDKLTKGRMHGSAIAIFVGLVLAYFGGWWTGGEKGLADVSCLTGIGVMGSAMLRDLTIVATAFGVRLDEFLKTGISGIVSLLAGVVVSFFVGATVAYSFGYTDAVSMTTIGAGAATYIVGPVTGGAIGASSEVVALSVAAGLVKSILVMIVTPMVAGWIGLNNPRSALIFGGLMGTTSGVAGGLAATDEKLVPYGAMTATFFTGIGCLLGPSVIFLIIKAIVG